jgi:hypothetical protein
LQTRFAILEYYCPASFPWKHLAGPMKLAWLANSTDGYMTGDYISTSIVGSQAFPGFLVAFAPQKGKLAEATYTAALNIVGGSLMTTRDAVLVAPHPNKGTMPGN